RVLSGLRDRLGIVGPARCHRHIAGLLEQLHPAIPARGQQPEPVNEDHRCGARSVRALDLLRLVLSDGRFDGHLLLLVCPESGSLRTTEAKNTPAWRLPWGAIYDTNQEFAPAASNERS